MNGAYKEWSRGPCGQELGTERKERLQDDRAEQGHRWQIVTGRGGKPRPWTPNRSCGSFGEQTWHHICPHRCFGGVRDDGVESRVTLEASKVVAGGRTWGSCWKSQLPVDPDVKDPAKTS